MELVFNVPPIVLYYSISSDSSSSSTQSGPVYVQAPTYSPPQYQSTSIDMTRQHRESDLMLQINGAYDVSDLRLQINGAYDVSDLLFKGTRNDLSIPQL